MILITKNIKNIPVCSTGGSTSPGTGVPLPQPIKNYKNTQTTSGRLCKTRSPSSPNSSTQREQRKKNFTRHQTYYYILHYHYHFHLNQYQIYIVKY